MPKLNLTEEDMVSLELRTLMTEQAIENLLRYFIDDETNIATYEVVSTLEDLENVLASVISDRGRNLTPEEEFKLTFRQIERPVTPPREEHLVILKVTSTSQESEESYEHYVGLRIQTDIGFGTLESSCTITYIDPVGNSIGENMKATIEKALQEVFEQISPYWGTPHTASYDYLTGEGMLEPHYVNERYITIIFNDNVYRGGVQSNYDLNSGLFLIYLLVCLERDISFISLEHVADRDSSSERIAGELKRIYLDEYKKDQNDHGEPRGLTNLQLSRLIGPTSYQHDDNSFRWQIQEQQEYFTELLNNAHLMERDRFLEVGSLISKKIVLLTREGRVSEIWEAIINQLIDEAIREIIRIIDNDLSYEAYTRHVDDEKERREAISQRAEDEFEINHGGLDGPDRQLMRIEEGLESEYESESSGSDDSGSNSKTRSSSNSDDERSNDSDSNSQSSAASNKSGSNDDSSDEIDDRFDREYSEGWLGELEEYIDSKYDNANHRYWARERLEKIHNDDISILLRNLFSSFDIDFMISQAIENSSLVNLLFEDIHFVDTKFKEWFHEIFKNSDFIIDNLVSKTKFILLIRSIIYPIFSGTSEYYTVFLEKFSEAYKRTLLFESQDFRIDFIEDLYNKAASRGDLIEMQSIWSVYSKMRKELIESIGKEVNLDIKNAIQAAIDQHKKYAMRFYPHKSVGKLIHRDEEGEEIEYNLVEASEPLAKVAREVKTKVSAKSKDTNIFVPKIVFFIEEAQGRARKKFITIRLDLQYEKRLLSRNSDDYVMKDAEENHRKKSKDDSLKGCALVEIEAEERKEIEEADLKQFQCSERVFIEILRKKQNIEEIAKLLIREIIDQFDESVSTGDRLFLVDSITFLGFSSQTACSLCAPALIYLQNSFDESEPLGMLVKAINSIIENKIRLITKGYNIEEQTQDYSQIEVNTIIYSDMNSNPQADDMADTLSHRRCKVPKSTYNPKAKLILPKKGIDISKSCAKISEIDGVSKYIKPYFIEYCSVIRDELEEVTNFSGIACISGSKSENHRMGGLFESHSFQGSKANVPTFAPTFSSSVDISRSKLKAQSDDKHFEEAKKQSIKEAEAKGQIGPRDISGFAIEDVKDDGNCFYYAIANQMKIINYNFIQNVPVGTDPNNSLRLAVQGINFRDREWANDTTFDVFVTEFPDVILAVIDTRNPNAGFTLYYMGDDGNVITNMGDPDLVIPNGRMTIRIAATGNHFMSVISHPGLTNGAITDTWNAVPIHFLPSSNVFSNETNEEGEFLSQEDQNESNLTSEPAVEFLGMTSLLLFTSYDSSSSI